MREEAYRILKPVKISPDEFEPIEALIKKAFRDRLYIPLLKEICLPKNTIKNEKQNLLIAAINAGRITYEGGKFEGKLNAGITKELKKLGAQWDKKEGVFTLPIYQLPHDVGAALSASHEAFKSKMMMVDQRITKILPEEITEGLDFSSFFDQTLYKTDDKIQKTLKDISVTAQLTPERRKRIANEWANNMDLWIKDFTAEEIKRLRLDVAESVYRGDRYESLARKIRTSYAVTERKAKFLARQETNLLLSKFKETRYQDSGIDEYKWSCVVGSPLHPVRPMHQALNGSIQRFSQPPITSPQGDRNNPGEDYNCRCVSLPIARFKT